MGVETGIDLDRLIAVSRRVQDIIGRASPARSSRRESPRDAIPSLTPSPAAAPRARDEAGAPDAGADGPRHAALAHPHRRTGQGPRPSPAPRPPPADARDRARLAARLLGDPDRRLDAAPRAAPCIEANPFLAWLVRANVAEAGLARRVRVVDGDALRAIPSCPGASTSPSSTPRRKTISTICASSSRSSSPAPSWSPTTRASPGARWRPTRVRPRPAAATSRLRLRRRRHGGLRPPALIGRAAAAASPRSRPAAG